MIKVHQKEKFSLSENAIYLNGAYMSPQLKSVEAIGIENLKRKSQPYSIYPEDFFTEKEVLRQRFAKLIQASDSDTIAIIPSVSYGVATVLKNIPFAKGDEIIVLEEQFPSNYYAWKELESTHGVIIKTIEAPPIESHRGATWNEKILEGINPHTKVVALPHVHWTDGTLFDLKSIRKRATEVGAYLIIDGTQSVGALPFSVEKIQPDALICGGYKWLLGPYSLGVAYFGERFHKGTPLENNWMNHMGSENFRNLVNYNETLKPKAIRYDVGESSNFILTPMLSDAIKQLIDWTPEAIQDYCASITEEAVNQLRAMGCFIEEEKGRAKHLFGIHLPDTIHLQDIQKKIEEAGIYVSYRGNAIRISSHLYNTKKDIEKLVSCFI